jgi:hypothetical protein
MKTGKSRKMTVTLTSFFIQKEMIRWREFKSLRKESNWTVGSIPQLENIIHAPEPINHIIEHIRECT